MSDRRVVVTAISAVSSLGVGEKVNWEALKEGRSGIRRIDRFDPSPFRCQIAGQVQGFKPEDFIPGKEVRTMDLFIQYGMAAGYEAMQASGLLGPGERVDEKIRARFASIVGCGLGGLPEIESGKQSLLEKGPKRISPFFIPKIIANLVPGQLSIRYGLEGPSFTTTSACSSGAHAIGEAFRMIKNNYADHAIAGGSEATISPLCIGGFDAMRALSTRNEEPEKASRPFDKDRDGFVCGEGAGILILEEFESAKKRGAEILGEVIGYGATADAHHMTAPAPEGRGAVRAMQLALEEASLSPDKILAINAHGTSTGLGDIAETKAIKTVFGDHAFKIKVSSTKSMIGHTLGAAGGIESVYSLQALKHQVVPPTINLDNVDEECDLDYVANEAQDWQHEYALSNSFGFGGTNACLIFRRV